jgi:hypothetical protein
MMGIADPIAISTITTANSFAMFSASDQDYPDVLRNRRGQCAAILSCVAIFVQQRILNCGNAD